MKAFRSAYLVLALSSALVTAQDEESVPAEDSSSTLMLMDVQNRRPEVTYAETFDMDMTTSFTIMGQTTEMKMNMRMESETEAENLPQGGQSVHLDITRISMTQDMGVMGKTSCDTDIAQADVDAMCTPFYDLLTDMTVVVDDQGRIAETSEDEALVVEQSKAADQLQATSRLLGFIPSHPIAIGESWDSSKELEDLGYFEGTSTFLGMDDEFNCAIISIVGTLDIDFQTLMKKMGDQMGALQETDISVTDSLMSAKTCWDDEAKMAPWTETQMRFTMHMPNPMAADDVLDMPIEELIKTTCKIKDAP